VMNASAPKNTHDRIAKLSFMGGLRGWKTKPTYHGVNDVNEIQQA
jgi:hypothetical protein